MTSEEFSGVLYSAAFDIPYAIGSVAIPLSTSPDLSSPSSPTHSEGHHRYASRPHSPTHAADQHDEDSHRKKRPHTPASSESNTKSRRGVTSGTISSVRRCTHHRYCYIRDGGSLERDTFYRWLMQRPQQTRESETDGFGSSKEGEEKRRVLREDGTTQSAAASPVFSPGVEAAETPSLFYASIDCVVFLLPNSFPNPRRVLRKPPFLIEDDTWAEHMVEVQLHFLPHLRIPPVTVVHQALLERRTAPPQLLSSPSTPDQRTQGSATAESATLPSTEMAEPDTVTTSQFVEVREICVPQLLASTFGKPKLPPVNTNVRIVHNQLKFLPDCFDRSSESDENSTAMPTTADATSTLPAAPLTQASNTVQHQQQQHQRSTTASTTVVVAEKADTLRLYHPTVPVLKHFRRLLALSTLPILHTLQEAYAQQHPPASAVLSNNKEDDGTDLADNSLQTPFRYLWSLPYEEVIAEYAEQRASTSVAVLQAVLDGLKRERAAMEESCQRHMDQIAELATKVLPAQLDEVHQHCLKLHRRE